jgi:hypothetical protein
MKYPVDKMVPGYRIGPIGHAETLLWKLVFTP